VDAWAFVVVDLHLPGRRMVGGADDVEAAGAARAGAAAGELLDQVEAAAILPAGGRPARYVLHPHHRVALRPVRSGAGEDPERTGLANIVDVAVQRVLDGAGVG